VSSLIGSDTDCGSNYSNRINGTSCDILSENDGHISNGENKMCLISISILLGFVGNNMSC
jgi:hypothetical protein